MRKLRCGCGGTGGVKVSEFSKSVPARGFLARLLGRTEPSYALGIVLGADSTDKVEGELAAARAALLEWAGRRARKDFVMVTLYGPEQVCIAVEAEVRRMCREDAAVARVIQGLQVELNFNGKLVKLAPA
jgi:hypothetical protein